LYLLYLILRRPTDNNQRYGLDQLAQDEGEYEEQMELGRMAAQGGVERRKAAEPEDIFDLDLNEGFESEEEDGDEVLNWAEETLAEERSAAVDANKFQ
jgi:hypothetical protein